VIKPSNTLAPSRTQPKNMDVRQVDKKKTWQAAAEYSKGQRVRRKNQKAGWNTIREKRKVGKEGDISQTEIKKKLGIERQKPTSSGQKGKVGVKLRARKKLREYN